MGTYVPLRHYQRDRRVSSIMIEIRRDMYCEPDGSVGAQWETIAAGLASVRLPEQREHGMVGVLGPAAIGEPRYGGRRFRDQPHRAMRDGVPHIALTGEPGIAARHRARLTVTAREDLRQRLEFGHGLLIRGAMGARPNEREFHALFLEHADAISASGENFRAGRLWGVSGGNFGNCQSRRRRLGPTSRPASWRDNTSVS